MINSIGKYSIVVFTGIVAAFLLNQSLYLSVGLILFALLIMMFAKRNGLFFANILLLLATLLLFSGDNFILNLSNEVNIYSLVSIWKFNIFEWWVFGLFFSFLLYRLKIAKEKQEPVFLMGPLKPLLFFTIGGLILGVVGAIRNHGDLSFSQIRYFCEGILLYLVMINTDLRKVELKHCFYLIVTLVSAKALYHLILYFLGQGFNFGIVGYIVMGYGDILHNLVLISLIIFSALIFAKNIRKRTFIGVWIFLLINSTAVILSLRRASMGVYLIGITTILAFSNIRVKLKSVFLFGLLLSFIVGALVATNKHILLNKIVKRVDSMNVFKYQDDKGKDITSSTGHISETINGWINVRENIILGKGFGTEIKKLQGWKYNYMMVHNELFFYWIRMGIFGMLMFFAMYLIPIFYCLKRIKNTSLQEYKWFYLPVMGFIIGKFVIALTVAPPTSLFITKSYIYFILLGFLMNKTLFKKEIIKVSFIENGK